MIIIKPIWKCFKHNESAENDSKYDKTCWYADNKLEKWTPVDLILRDALNNGIRTNNFTGLTYAESKRAIEWIIKNKQELIDLNMVSKKAWNNSGFDLWDNYDFDGVL